MFPNVRLLVGALFASVIALSCGFGVFAAFRVNHDPLSRLPADTAPLQLVVDAPAQPPANWGMPVRPPVGGAQTSEALIGAPTRVPVRRAAVELPDALTSGRVKVEPATGAPQPRASQPTQPSASVAPSVPAAPQAPVSTAPPAPTIVTNAEQTSTAEPASLQTAPVSKQNTTRPTAETPQAAIPVAATEPSAKPAPPAIQPAEITGSVPQSAAPAAAPEKPIAAKPLRKTARKPLARRRVVVWRRVTRQARAPAAAQFGDQNSIFSEPAFQSAPDFSQPEPQRRTASKTAKPVKTKAAVSAPAWSNAQ